VRECIAIDVVATEDICDEHAMEFALFQLLSQVDPVLDRVEIGRTIVGVLPEAGTLVAGAFIEMSAMARC
jgi:hypothetical protein